MTGRICTIDCPAPPAQRARSTRSGNSPRPQLRLVGTANSGTLMPLARVTAALPHARASSRATPGVEAAGLDDQAEDEEGFAGEVEEEAGMDEHAVFGHERHDEILFRADRGHLDHRRPPAFGAKHRGGRPPAAGLA